MKRQPNRLVETEFDALIVGGGIQGIAVFYELCRSGFKTALIEAQDFAAGTSANSLKVIHGGLRYLQSANIVRMRRSIQARRGFMQLAPDLVRPQGFIVPTEGVGLQHALSMKAALMLNDLVSMDRNRGLPAQCRLPKGRVISSHLEDVFPGNPQAFPRGGALWFDGLIHDVGRVAIALVKDGYARGGVACNYLRAQRYLRSGQKISGAQAVDLEADKDLEIRSRLVIDVTGMGRASLRQADFEAHDGATPKWLKATNLVLKKQLCGEYAVGLKGVQPSASGAGPSVAESRYFFFVPYEGHTLFGTFYFPIDDPSVVESASAEEFAIMLDQAQQLCPGTSLNPDDVSLVQVGVVPAALAQGDQRLEMATHPSIRLGTRAHGAEGLLEVQGVKYTESLEVARNVAEMAAGFLKKPYRFMPYASLSFDPNDKQTRSIDVLTQQSVVDEMALHLSDVILRRTTIGELGDPGDEVLRKTSEIMSASLSWSSDTMARELQIMRSHYKRCSPIVEQNKKI